jgi:hypothetical protein
MTYVRKVGELVLPRTFCFISLVLNVVTSQKTSIDIFTTVRKSKGAGVAQSV